MLTPQQWSGAGMLGCKLTLYSAEEYASWESEYSTQYVYAELYYLDVVQSWFRVCGLSLPYASGKIQNKQVAWLMNRNHLHPPHYCCDAGILSHREGTSSSSSGGGGEGTDDDAAFAEEARVGALGATGTFEAVAWLEEGEGEYEEAFACVDAVENGSPAQTAGLRVGDLVSRVGSAHAGNHSRQTPPSSSSPDTEADGEPKLDEASTADLAAVSLKHTHTHTQTHTR
jgi:hypothetical protein